MMRRWQPKYLLLVLVVCYCAGAESGGSSFSWQPKNGRWTFPVADFSDSIGKKMRIEICWLDDGWAL
eukprot:symbB.v1.2.012349.t1/scaffold854.1/size229663/3